MPETAFFQQNLTIGGVDFAQNLSATGNGREHISPTVPAAKTGTLSVRTDNTVGTLTMDTGHGFATANVIDLFWDGGSRRGVVCGTVATNSVPISGGTGDNLPPAATAITAMIPTQVTAAVTGDDVDALGSACPVSGWVVYRNGTTVLLAHQILANTGGSRVWLNGSGVTNPLAGGTVTNILFSHSDATQPQTLLSAYVH